jgi:hypothetical protein
MSPGVLLVQWTEPLPFQILNLKSRMYRIQDMQADVTD